RGESIPAPRVVAGRSRRWVGVGPQPPVLPLRDGDAVAVERVLDPAERPAVAVEAPAGAHEPRERDRLQRLHAISFLRSRRSASAASFFSSTCFWTYSSPRLAHALHAGQSSSP